jgi:anti-sigma factor RsiW
MTHPGELLSAYLDGELSPSEMRQMLDHMSRCGSCAGDLERLQRVRSGVRSLPVLELPPGRIEEARPQVVPLHRNRGLWVGAAAAVVAIVITLAALLTPPPSALSVDDLNSRFGARVSLDPAFGPAKVMVPDVRDVTE